MIAVVEQKEMADKRLQLRAAVLADGLKECTFHPKTNEGANRQLIQHILAHSDGADSAVSGYSADRD